MEELPMLILVLTLLAIGVLSAGVAMLPVPRALALFLAVVAAVLGGVALVLTALGQVPS